MPIKDSKKTHTKVRQAIVRIEQGKPKIISPDRKISVAAVAEESGVSRALIHRDFPDLLERIKGNVNKGVRQQRDEKHGELQHYKELNRKLRKEISELRALLEVAHSQNTTLILENKKLKGVESNVRKIN